MRFIRARLDGIVRLEIDRLDDARGSFARIWCARDAEAHGINTRVVQCNVSVNYRRGTLRGLHFQAAPHAEAKLIRCTRGAAFDVAVDLRPGSPTFCQWEAFELSEDSLEAIYVPEGFAHGFQTRVDNTQMLYQMSEFYVEAAARTVRWNDPAFGIEWPLQDPILSPKDATCPDFGT